jgi:hypothetical protein
MAALQTQDFNLPTIMLSGPDDYAIYASFRSQVDNVQKEVVIELSTTLGGDPEVARMMSEDVRFHSDVSTNRRQTTANNFEVQHASIAELGKAAIVISNFNT